MATSSPRALPRRLATTKAVQPRRKPAPKRQAPGKAPAQATPTADRLQSVMDWLKKTGTARVRDGMARFAIPSDTAFGVTVGALRAYARRLGTDQALAQALWQTGRYEARMLATFIGDPSAMTPAQMDRWVRDFDNWAIVDTACFALFDRSPHAWSRVPAWVKRRGEFERRAGFALLWALTVHDRQSGDTPFLRALPLIERGADDERHFVAKAVDMALRAIGKRSLVLNNAAIALAEKLAGSTDAAPRWVGKHALRELTSASVRQRLTARRRQAA